MLIRVFPSGLALGCYIFITERNSQKSGLTTWYRPNIQEQKCQILQEQKQKKPQQHGNCNYRYSDLNTNRLESEICPIRVENTKSKVGL